MVWAEAGDPVVPPSSHSTFDTVACSRRPSVEDEAIPRSQVGYRGNPYLQALPVGMAYRDHNIGLVGGIRVSYSQASCWERFRRAWIPEQREGHMSTLTGRS